MRYGLVKLVQRPAHVVPRRNRRLLLLAITGCSREPEMLGQGDLAFDRAP
ncbi:hypothetical protein [Caulobacter sp. B11]|nr:hypothetical protein [Caulobacter sp. B11]